MLEMNHVSFSYTNKKNNLDRLVIEDRSEKFKPGTIYCIYGASGAGKTTCLSLLGGLDSPTKGTITLDDVDIKSIGYSNLRRKYISYIFQDFHLFPYMNAIENVMMAMDNKKSKEERKQYAIELLNSVGIQRSEMKRRVTMLSGGQKQRVAIARALATESQYILADEPTGNLDKENTINIISILKNLAKEQNKCVIIVTHSERVREQCDVCISFED